MKACGLRRSAASRSLRELRPPRPVSASSAAKSAPAKKAPPPDDPTPTEAPPPGAQGASGGAGPEPPPRPGPLGRPALGGRGARACLRGLPGQRVLGSERWDQLTHQVAWEARHEQLLDGRDGRRVLRDRRQRREHLVEADWSDGRHDWVGRNHGERRRRGGRVGGRDRDQRVDDGLDRVHDRIDDGVDRHHLVRDHRVGRRRDRVHHLVDGAHRIRDDRVGGRNDRVGGRDHRVGNRVGGRDRFGDGVHGVVHGSRHHDRPRRRAPRPARRQPAGRAASRSMPSTSAAMRRPQAPCLVAFDPSTVTFYTRCSLRTLHILSLPGLHRIHRAFQAAKRAATCRKGGLLQIAPAGTLRSGQPAA